MKRSRGALAALLLTLAACGAGTEEPRLPVASAGPGPMLVVERFLQAANATDLETMTQLFGTAEATIEELDGQQLAEQRMYLLAQLLQHQDFTVQGQRTVPGRSREATELLVRLTREGETVVVPHRVVRRAGGGWIIEFIDVTPLTADG